MDNVEQKMQLFALILCDIRRGLSHRLGLGRLNPEYFQESKAAHLAYAIHNEALAVLEGKNFDIEVALKKFEALREPFNDDICERYRTLLERDSEK